LAADHCALQDNVIHSATRDFDCFSKEYNTYYDIYPAYRHEDVTTAEGVWNQCTGTGRATRCTCMEPTFSCSSSGTAAEIETCNLSNWNTIIKPYFQCKMRRRLETVQKVWVYMNHVFFRSHVSDTTIHNRIPAMLKKEMGEKYCQEFCNGMLLDHTKHSLSHDTNEEWRETTCTELCIMSFARVHNVKKILKNELFVYKPSTGNSEYNAPDMSLLSTTIDTSLFFYSNHQLWSSDTEYWKDQFGDLLKYCANRHIRDHMMNVITDPTIKTKCNALTVATDADNNVCMSMVDGNQLWRHCANWYTPHCVLNSAGTEGNCQKLEGADVSSDGSCLSSVCNTQHSMPTSWASDAELEFCFPAKELDITNPTQDLINTCKTRYFLSNQNWPVEFWLKKKADNTTEYVMPKEFYAKIQNLEEPWTNPARTWAIGTEAKTGDLFYHESNCPFATECWLEEVGVTEDPSTLVKKRTFLSADDYNAQKPYLEGALHECKYVKMEENPPATADDGKSVDQYYTDMFNCRDYDFIEVSPYVKGSGSNVDYSMFEWPGYDETVVNNIAAPTTAV